MPKKQFDDEPGVLSNIGLFAGYSAAAASVGTLLLSAAGLRMDIKRAVAAAFMGAATITAISEWISQYQKDWSPGLKTVHARYILYASSAALAGVIGGLELAILGIQGDTTMPLEYYAAAPAAGVGTAIAALMGAKHAFLSSL